MRSLLPLVVVAGCYSPSYRNCEVTCASGTCPSGLSCVAGMCVTPGGTCTGDRDGGTDTPPVDALGAWGTPTEVQSLGAPIAGDDPSLPDDQLELYANVGADIVYFKRSTASAPFGQQISAPGLNSSLQDGGASLSGDGLTIVFMSNRPPMSPNGGDYDLYIATRPDRASEFLQPSALDPLLSQSSDANPSFSHDGTTIVFSSARTGMGDLYTSTKTGNVWSAPARIDSLSDPSFIEDSPHLSGDGLELYFSSSRTGNTDLYVARRATLTSTFGTPEPITELNTDAAGEVDPWISPDGHDMYFARLVGGTYSLWRATR